MPTYRINTLFASTTGLPADTKVCTMHFSAANDAAAGTALGPIEDFWNTPAAGGVGAVCDYIGRQVSRAANACSFQIYKLPGSAGPLGSPIQEEQFTLSDTDGAAINLPDEVAICLSYHADFTGVLEESGATRPKARRRGRFFIPCPNTNASTATAGSTGVPRVTEQCQEDITESAAEFLAGDTLALGVNWVVFSRVDWLARNAIEAWVDDAFDTQRRRGPGAAARTINTF